MNYRISVVTSSERISLNEMTSSASLVSRQVQMEVVKSSKLSASHSPSESASYEEYITRTNEIEEGARCLQNGTMDK